MLMRVINPYTGESTEVPEITNLEDLFSNAQRSFAVWSEKTIGERAQVLGKAYEAILGKREPLARLMAEEMGKPISHCKIELERTLEEWDYMLKNGEGFLAPEKVEEAHVHFAPLGVVAVISPWNFPVLLPLRAIIPALLAGNAVLFKPSELSPRVAQSVGEAFEGIAPLFTAVGGKELGAQVVKLPVRAIAFTGSTAVGKEIARESAQSLKRLILELGGLDAAVVLPDADLKHAASEIVRANARNSGQVCNAAKRALVHESIYSEFVREAVVAANTLKYGDPLDPSTDVGPLVSQAQLARVKGFVEDAVSKGATVHQVSAPAKGYLFPQAILSNVPPTALLLKQEPFGPLLPVIPFSSEAEAIEIANDTPFGLTASVWTSDVEAMARIASKLDVGLVRHNTHAAMQSGIPWGGSKESGVGRMKTKEGLREFTNVKVIAC